MRGTRPRLRQVALNFIGNAVKFTDSGAIHMEVETGEQEVTVAVSDTGIGIPAGEQNKLFREFFRTERSIALGASGLGLGLAISKQIIEKHGGRIGFSSPGRLNTGSTFFFTLPTIPAPPEGQAAGPPGLLSAGQAQDSAHPPDALHLPDAAHLEAEHFTTHVAAWVAAGRTGRPVILVVDDDPGILDLHCRLVEMAGYHAVKARNGREALNMIKHVSPDLILLDLVMPGMDGSEMLETLWIQEGTRNIPVIVLTGRVLSEGEMEQFNRSVSAILNKGMFDAGEILNHIDAALTRQARMGSLTQRLVRRAVAYIHLHYAEPLNREMIANQVGISADYLTECFRKEYGVTPVKYLNRYRIRQACLLLEKTERSIKDVAMAVGFYETAHFSRIFKREMKMTPRAYRKGLINNGSPR